MIALVRQAHIELFRKPFKFFILFLSFTILFSALLTGGTLNASVNSAKETVINRIGAYLLLSDINDEASADVDNSILDQVSAIKYVSGINRNITDYAIAENFKTVRDHTGEDPDTDPSWYEDCVNLTPDSLALDANLNVELDADFRNGYSVLVDGSFPSESCPGLLVEERLAEENNLTIGDSLTLSGTGCTELSSPIVGIYRSSLPFEIESGNCAGEAVYAWSPYNKIYSDLNTGCTFFNVDENTLSLYIYSSSLLKMDKIAAQIKELNIDWNHNVLCNMTESEYQLNFSAYQIEVLANYSKLIFGYSAVVGFLFIELIMRIYTNYFLRNSGIYCLIGARKRYILEIYAISVITVVLLAGGVSVIISDTVVPSVLNNLINTTVMEENWISSFSTGVNEPVYVSFVALDVAGYLKFGAYCLGIIFLALLPLLLRLLKCRPRELMEIH